MSKTTFTDQSESIVWTVLYISHLYILINFVALILWINTSKKGPKGWLFLLIYLTLLSLISFWWIFSSSVRSPESDTKLERNIAFIAEVLARHIFNFTTKVSFMTQKSYTQSVHTLWCQQLATKSRIHYYIGTGHQWGTALSGRAQNLWLLPVVLTDQRNFSLVTSLFWSVKMLKMKQ